MRLTAALAFASTAVLSLAACQTAAPVALAPAHNAALIAAVAAPTRTPANLARDVYRHPVETLSFFGVRPGDTVVEIWPGGGWYTEILARYLASGGGRLVLGTLDGQLGGVAKLREANPALYANVTAATFPALDAGAARVPDGSADVVLTFRNVHNWRMGFQRPNKQDYSAEAFRQMYAMLKPGGVLGVVDHRLPESASEERERSSGYMKVSTVRRLAEQAGFRLAASSEINANPRDTADWPDGVWTLPPSLRLKDKDRERYLAVGESDRMTLKFVKPR
ncbi:MAG TPA: methyltransferase domain-containing protein [Sphingomicrobium sp.]|jgi:predicted methyltransferase